MTELSIWDEWQLDKNSCIRFFYRIKNQDYYRKFVLVEELGSGKSKKSVLSNHKMSIPPTHRCFGYLADSRYHSVRIAKHSVVLKVNKDIIKYTEKVSWKAKIKSTGSNFKSLSKTLQKRMKSGLKRLAGIFAT